jgi:hypothetical protein
LSDDRAAELLCERRDAADVISVPVRDADQVAALGVLLAFRTLRVLVEPGVDIDRFSSFALEPEAGVA